MVKVAEKVVRKVGAITLVTLVVLYLLGFRIVVIQGTSMLPTLKSGQITFAKCVDPNGLNEGDVGVFENENGGLTVHRAIYKTSVGYCFKGDNNVGFDEFVPKEYVRYKLLAY